MSPYNNNGPKLGRTFNRQPPGTATECRSCGQLVVWATTRRGKRMPLDVQPDAAGKFKMLRHGDDLFAIHIRDSGPMAKRLPQDATTHTAHFETCPRSRVDR